ncbi:MAG: sodium:alanine symporter family protein [Candidatus Caldatribacteriota bacterium]|nr:sodium:alanine symporter family protein [Atribacterota bacterium]MDD3641037.1 sodium:alanine symporter family protein [Atribacterota bacterium]MDD4289494.1 sodium:alanine symporter family protein [Atribacterota bacterium]MDI9597366.1 sodium:alanine symporter family protein [Atribacterota bacterium]
MTAIMNFLTIVDDFVWGPPMLIILAGTGLFLTIRLGFPQFKHSGHGWKLIFNGLTRKDQSEQDEGEITPFQALTATLAATVGNGNIAGVATAIAAGGPGAVLWMWIIALVGMATKLCEATLGVKYRIKDKDGALAGGTMYFIERGLGQKWLGWIFALFGALAAFGIGDMVQTNSMALVGNSVFGIPQIITGIVLAVLLWLVVVGGIKRIGSVTEYLVPFMALFYIIGALIVIISRINMVPWAIGEIFRSAFSGKAAFGGFAGATVAQAMRFGVARGIFSNEAGLGSGSIANAVARTKHPVRQGSIAMIDVMIDTLIICSMTALVILLTDSLGTGYTSTQLTAHAFGTVLGGIGGPIVALGSLLFGFSTIITWCYYGQQCSRFILGPSVVMPYAWLFVIVAFLGSVVEVPFVWLLTDALNGAMAIPNLIGLLFLSGVMAEQVKEYFSNPEMLKI